MSVQTLPKPEPRELHLGLPGNTIAVLHLEGLKLDVALMVVAQNEDFPVGRHHPLSVISAPLYQCTLSPRDDVKVIPNRLVLGNAGSIVVEDDEQFREVAKFIGRKAP